jgi:hypothetical protein
MEQKGYMKVLGGRVAPYWQRFDRLQRSATLLLGTRIGPKGFHRFKTHEEFEAWKMSHRLMAPRLPVQDDLVRLCRELNAHSARYMVVGGFAVIQHGFLRATEDIDLLLEGSLENQAKVKKSLGNFTRQSDS